MNPAWLLVLALVILLVGGGVIWWLTTRQRATSLPQHAPQGVAKMGYGAERWERELALWRGTLRRLHIQARHRQPVPEGLQRQIEEAEAHIAEAERQLERAE